MNYHIITYGCQMNKSDSERIAGVLEEVGFQQASTTEEADLVVVNICSVRQSAIDRAYNKIKNQNAKVKNIPHQNKFGAGQANQNSKIILTGCILKKDRSKFRKYSDAIFNINDLPELPELLKKLGFQIGQNGPRQKKHYLKLEPDYQSEIIAYVPIMTGCNNFCTYCVVPYARGREISRPAEEIICEIENLVKKGVKEVWLLGQNVNSYKSKIKNPASAEATAGKQKSKIKNTNQNAKFINFAALLKMINNIPGNFWIRFTSSHPKDLSKEMIESFAKSQKATPYFNLPIQSGSNEILRAMNRPYTVEKYKQLVKETRSAFKKARQGLEKEVAISTDIIVGFPGETKKQFQETKKTFKEIGFAFAYISRYSPRPQTAAFQLKDNVSSVEKKRREKELLKIVEQSMLSFNKKFLGKIVEVLVLQKKNNFYFGKTRHYQTVKIPFNPVDKTNQAGPRSKSLIGKFVKVKIRKATPYGLEAKT